ncbi:MAG: DUF3747 domain-containing protein [Spirulina sp. SIO3F2]|nr:DUF3747 domain-containing protein [Spirulina sp. SIO3F2]
MRKLLLTTLLAFGTTLPWLPPAAAQVSPFGNQRVDDRRFVLMAAPFGVNQRGYQLLIVEQSSNRRQCWQEYGTAPTQVNPLLLNFDFTNICKRMTDSNGYSVRVGNEDLGWRFILSLVERQNEWVLVANSARERNVQMEVGRTRGKGNGYLKIELDPGWSLTRRTYNGRALDHIYLTGDPQVVSVPTNSQRPLGQPPNTLPPVDQEIIIQPLPPRDTGNQSGSGDRPSTNNDLPPLPPPPPTQRIP